MAGITEGDALAPDVASRIDALFASVNRPDHPGAAIAVLRNGALAHQRCFGLANVEDCVPVTPDTVFRLGSVTKHICATAMLVLENRGLLTLDDPVERYLPELSPTVGLITLRQLLTMTSGLQDGVILPIFAGMGAHLNISRDQHLATLLRQSELMFAPGTRMLYSNSNYFLLSLVIERISRRPLSEFFSTEIFHPLGMQSAQLTQNPLEVVPHKAKGYVPALSGASFDAGLFLYEASGDGGVDASIRDMIRWCANYREDRVFGPGYRDRIEAQVRFPGGRISPYRLGLTVMEESGRTRVGHAGGMSGYLADFGFYPEPDIAIVLLTNWMDINLLEAVDQIHDILVPRTSIHLHKPLLSTGLYTCQARRLTLHIEGDEDRTICFMMGDRSPLVQTAADAFRPSKGTVDYEISRGKSDAELSVTFGNGPPVSFIRWLPRDRPVVTAHYEGRYRSQLLGETHVVSAIHDGGLEVALDSPLRRLSWRTLKPLEPDWFCAPIATEPSLSNLTLHFQRDAFGRVTGFRYNTFRCRDLLFERLPR